MERQFYSRLENTAEKSFYMSHKRSSMNVIIFFLLALPLSILYFVLIVVGLSLGAGTLIIWIGLPITFVTLALIRGLASIERQMIRGLLQKPLPEPMGIQHTNTSKWNFIRHFGELLRDPLTWTSLIYMILKLPLSIISFVITVTLSSISVVLTLMPVAYLITVFVSAILAKQGIVTADNSQLQIMILPGYTFIDAHSYFEPVMLMHSFILVPLGLLFGLLTRWLLAKMADASAALARALLCFDYQATTSGKYPKE